MSKHVFLQRHTEAQNLTGIKDFSRNLTTHGIKQAIEIAEFLNTLSVKPEKIICSPANRTKQTLDQIKQNVKFSFYVEFIESIYNASIEDLYQLISSQNDSINSIMIIGHNPNITAINMEFYLDKSSKLFRKAFDYSIPGKLTVLEIESSTWKDVFIRPASISHSFFPLIDSIPQ